MNTLWTKHWTYSNRFCSSWRVVKWAASKCISSKCMTFSSKQKNEILFTTSIRSWKKKCVILEFLMSFKIHKPSVDHVFVSCAKKAISVKRFKCFMCVLNHIQNISLFASSYWSVCVCVFRKPRDSGSFYMYGRNKPKNISKYRVDKILLQLSAGQTCFG